MSLVVVVTMIWWWWLKLSHSSGSLSLSVTYSFWRHQIFVCFPFAFWPYFDLLFNGPEYQWTFAPSGSSADSSGHWNIPWHWLDTRWSRHQRPNHWSDRWIQQRRRGKEIVLLIWFTNCVKKVPIGPDGSRKEAYHFEESPGEFMVSAPEPLKSRLVYFLTHLDIEVTETGYTEKMPPRIRKIQVLFGPFL